MTTQTQPLSLQQILLAQSQAAAIASAVSNSVGSNTFVFFAAFDGTNNGANPPADGSGDSRTTAIKQLYDQVFPNNISPVGNVGGAYEAGVGVPGSMPFSAGWDKTVTAQSIANAQAAYDKFAQQATQWLASHPSGSLTSMITGFSRGGAAAAIFAEMLYENGLVNSAGKILIPPGTVGAVSAALIIDPVLTGVNGNMEFPPGVQNLVVVRAQNEYRDYFPAADYTGDNATIVPVIGNHGDAGDLYDNGLGGIYLGAYTNFFHNAGLTSIGPVPSSRAYAAGTPVYVHSESQSTAEILTTGDFWDATYNSLDIRDPNSEYLNVARHVVVPGTNGNAATITQTPDGTATNFTAYNGDIILGGYGGSTTQGGSVNGVGGRTTNTIQNFVVLPDSEATITSYNDNITVGIGSTLNFNSTSQVGNTNAVRGATNTITLDQATILNISGLNTIINEKDPVSTQINPIGNAGYKVNIVASNGDSITYNSTAPNTSAPTSTASISTDANGNTLITSHLTNGNTQTIAMSNVSDNYTVTADGLTTAMSNIESVYYTSDGTAVLSQDDNDPNPHNFPGNSVTITAVVGGVTTTETINADVGISNDLALDSIAFEGHSITTNFYNGMVDAYGRTYNMGTDGTTLIITGATAGDSLTISNFRRGDFGVNMTYSVGSNYGVPVLPDTGVYYNHNVLAFDALVNGQLTGYVSFTDIKYYYGMLVTGINNNGQVIAHSGYDGTYILSTAYGTWMETPVGLDNNNTLNALHTWGMYINDNGVAVGDYLDSDYVQHGFVSANGVVTSTVSIAGATSTGLISINDNGVIVGNYVDSNGHEHGFELIGDNLTYINVAGATDTVVYGINNNGVIVGTYYINNVANGFIDDHGVITTINMAGAAAHGGTTATDITDDGQVFGYYYSPTGAAVFSANPTYASTITEDNATFSVTDIRDIYGDGNTITAGNCAITLVGDNNTVTANTHPDPGNTFLIDGKGNTLTATDGDKVTVAGNGQINNTTQYNTVSLSTGTLVVDDATSVVLNGSNNAVYAGDEDNITFNGTGNTITIGTGSDLIITGTNAVDATDADDTDGIVFDGVDIEKDITFDATNTSGAYSISGSTLTITSGSDALTITNFVNGDFGIDISYNETVSNSTQTIANNAYASITGDNNTIFAGTGSNLFITGTGDMISVGANSNVTLASGSSAGVSTTEADAALKKASITVSGTEESISYGDPTSIILEAGSQASITGTDGIMTASNAYGGSSDIENIINWNVGGSQLQRFTSLPTDEAEEIKNYSGANATGVLNSEIINYTAGNSRVEQFNVSAAISEEISEYSSLDGTGILISELVNNEDGTSVKKIFTGLQGDETEEDFTYAGANATGTLTSQATYYSDGSHTVKSFNPTADIVNESQSFIHSVTGTAGVLFSGSDANGNRGLWITDGTVVGTRNLTPGENISIPSVSEHQYETIVTIGNKVIFLGNEQIWVTNGMVGSATQLTNITNFFPRYLTSIGNKAVFLANDTNGNQQVWTTDGTVGGTTRLTSIPGGINSDHFAELGNKALFAGNDANGSQQLWITDGTIAGTTQLTAVVSGMNPDDIVTVGNEVFFEGLDTNGKGQLWKTDGTAAGTVQITTLSAGIYPDNMAAFGNKVLFGAPDSNGHEQLWISDGSAAGTIQVTNGSSLSPTNITAFGSSALFFSGAQLWITDGTAAGTIQLASGSGGSLQVLSLLGNKALFFKSGSNGAYQLWVTDGTASGTLELTTSLNTSFRQIIYDSLEVVGNQAIFAARGPDGKTSLWETDGTIAGTEEMTGIANAAAGGINPSSLTAFSTVTTTDLLTSETINNTDGTSIGEQITYNGDGSTTKVIAKYSGADLSDSQIYQETDITSASGQVSIAISGTGDQANISNATITLADSTSATLSGSANSITLGSHDSLVIAGTGDMINAASGADLTTDTIMFDGAAVTGNANSGSINTLGNSYKLNGSTLTVTSVSGDTLTVNNFTNGDFGLNVTVNPYTISTFDAPGYTRTLVNGTNAGEILGRTANGGYRDASGNFTYIPGTNTSLVGGNNNGVYVGFSFDTSGYYHGLLDDNGTISTLDYPDASYTVLQSVSNSGEIVGWYISNADNENHGLIDIGGTLTRYDIAGAAWTVIDGVNNKGVITGSFGLTDNDAEGFIDDHGVITILDFPGTAKVTLADAINDLNQVVGTFTDAAGATHSFVYQNGVYTQIDVPAANGSTTIANGINDAGQIVGEYTNSSTGKLSGFIANPTGVNLVNGTGTNLTVADATTETISGNGNTISVGTNDTISLFGNSNIINGAGGSDLTTDVLSFDGNQLSGAAITGGTDSHGNSYVQSGTTLTITSGTGEVLTLADFINGDFGVTLPSSGPVTYNESNSAIAIADNVNAVVTGSSNTITIGNGDTVSVSGYNNGVTVSSSGSVVSDDSSSSLTMYNVTGNSDSVTLAGYGDTATISGSGDTVVVSATAASVTESGSGNNSITLGGDSETATIAGSNDILTLSGYADAATINGAGNETVHLTGTNDSLTETGSGGNHITLSGDSETAVLSGSNSFITLSGYGDAVTINGAGHETVNLTGTNDSLAETGSGSNTITLGGDSQTATIGGSNSTITLSGYADAVTINGAGNEVIHLIGTNDSLHETGFGGNSITLSGDSETATIGGSNSTITLSGYADSATITGAGNEVINLTGTNETLTEAGYGSNTITLSGDTDTATIGGSNSSITLSGYNDSATITGSNETIILSGTNASVTLSGQNDVVTAAAGTTVNIAAGDAVVINGNGVVVTGGASARATINHADGTSAVEVFNQSATILSNTKNYSGLNGTGTLVSQVIDYTDGTSRQNLFTGLASGVTEESLFYSGMDMSGVLAKEMWNYAAGNSTVEWFNPSSTIASNTKYYDGSNGTGNLLSQVIDYTNGTSQQKLFSNLPSGVTQESLFYSGLDLTGALTKTIIDYANGSSVIERFNLSSTLLSHTSNYDGLDGTGNLTSETYDMADGTSRQYLYSNLASGISAQKLYYSGADLSGSLTKQITDYANGTSTVELFNSSSTILTNTKYYTGLDGTGTLTSQTIDFTDGTSRQVLYTNLPAGVSQEQINYSGADLTGTVTSTNFIGTSGNDTLTATATKQTLTGNGGSDTYQFGRGDGYDTIRNGLSTNTGPSGELLIGSGITKDQLWFEQKGNNLQVDILGTTDHMTIANWYSNSYAQLSDIRTAGGNVIDSQLAQLVQAMATYSANHTGFNPATATAMPTDPTLQSTLAASWH
ncbi:MAG TPA: hypothetical protein VFT64_05805 [Rickettsiales bacterium]|nr:hypothetical protein [Rickettsiales bacterium]